MENVLHDIFIQEAEENLEILESRIIGIEENPEDKDIINEIFRSIHSIKGGAGLAGFTGIKDFSHIAEDLFEKIRNGELKIEQNLISLTLKAIDILKLMIQNIKDGKDSNDNVDTEETLSGIKSYLNVKEDSLIPISNTKEEKEEHLNSFYIKLSFYENIFDTGIDPLMFISDLKKIGNILHIKLITEDFPDKDKFDPEQFYLNWQLFYQTEKNDRDLNDIFCFVIDESDINIINLNTMLHDATLLQEYKIDDKTILDFMDQSTKVNERVTPSTVENTTVEQPLDRRERRDRRKGDRRGEEKTSESYIRVPTTKLEKIFNSVSELLISQARLNMLIEENEDLIPESFSAVQDSLKNITQLIQEQVTSLRMMSLASTFDRFKRVVRDIATAKGKIIKLHIEGQDTELDKNMIEKLNDPLKHLVRNCIDHGIETEKERINKGKLGEGNLYMSAFLESGKVVITIKDDGCGINREKLLKKAEEKGVIDENSDLTDGEILNLVFHPGLSTADKITDLSGRGVGMDVVKSYINELHGNIQIHSVEGEGTTFKLYLPLTLAILDGMLVSAAKEKYIIPTLSILEIFKPTPQNLKTISAEQEVVFFRDEYIPIIRLHKVFNISNPITKAVDGELIVIISGGAKAALLVDKVLEQYQVVLKSLQKNFKKVDYISSATILGDGDVALILDIQSLFNNRGA